MHVRTSIPDTVGCTAATQAIQIIAATAGITVTATKRPISVTVEQGILQNRSGLITAVRKKKRKKKG